MDSVADVWLDIEDSRPAIIDTPLGSIRPLNGLSQYMVSGNLAAAARDAGVDAEGAGALGLAAGGAYSVRVARDRLLVVSDRELLSGSGWNSAGYAITAMHAALSVIEMDEPLAQAMVRRATTLEATGASRSAAVEFAGIGAYLYRHGGGATARLHVDRSVERYVWGWFAGTVPFL